MRSKKRHWRSIVLRMTLFKYFQNKYGEDVFRNYSTFMHFLNANDIYVLKSEKKPKVRYETKIAEQLQVDWKEDLKFRLKNGEIIEYNLFAATFSYSRYHCFVYSKTRTTEDFLRCLIDVLYMAGGLLDHVLTDNMAAIVSIKNGTKKKHEMIRNFENDTNMKIRLCKVRHPWKSRIFQSIR